MSGPARLADRGAVLFSGGTDSTLAAYLLARRVEEVSLLTFNPGFVFFIENSRRHVDRLARSVPDTHIKHVILDIAPLTREVLVGDLSHDLPKYGFNLTSLCCLGCRMSMHAAGLIHCLENEIPVIVDGSIRKQSTIPEQLESFIRRNRHALWGRYGVHHYSPIYEEERSDRKLDELGMSFRTSLKKQFIFFDTQGTCPLGVTADVYGRLFYGKVSGEAREVDSWEYSEEKYPVIQRLVERHFAQRDDDLEARIAMLKKKNESLPEAWPVEDDG